MNAHEQPCAKAETTELGMLVGPFWSTIRVQDALAITQGALEARRVEGSILRLEARDGTVLYPTSQFVRHNGKVDVRPALVQFFIRLRTYDPWSVAVLLHTPAPELDTLTPLMWIRRRLDPDALAELAHAVALEWGAGSRRPEPPGN